VTPFEAAGERKKENAVFVLAHPVTASDSALAAALGMEAAWSQCRVAV